MPWQKQDRAKLRGAQRKDIQSSLPGYFTSHPIQTILLVLGISFVAYVFDVTSPNESRKQSPVRNNAVDISTLQQTLISSSAIRKLAHNIAGDSSTCFNVLQETLERSSILDLNHHSVIFRNDPLVKYQSKRLKVVGDLYCIPYAVKDNIDVALWPTSAGSSALISSAPPLQNSPAVERLTRQGALVIAKTNMDEFAMDYYSSSTAGGQTLNAIDPTLTPGGSSGGSGVAVALGIVPFALGTDTGGSVRIPSSFSGITGLRPTIGLLELDGVFPLSPTRDTIGPMARSVLDIAIVLDAMVDSIKLPKWFTSSEAVDGEGNTQSYMNCVLRGMGRYHETVPRIGVLTSMFTGNHKSTSDAQRIGEFVMKRLKEIARNGIWELVFDFEMKKYGPVLNRDWLASDISTSNWELCESGNQYLSNRRNFRNQGEIDETLSNLVRPNLNSDPVPASMSGVLESIEQLKGHANVKIAKKLRKKLKWCGRNFRTDAKYQSVAVRRRKEMLSGLSKSMKASGLTAIAYPTFLEFPAKVATRQPFCSNNRISPITGMPAITVPIGELDGLPIGLELLGLKFAECDIMSLAALIQLLAN